MANIDIDLKDLIKGAKELEFRIKAQNSLALFDVATEALRLSQKEVPHDKGTLQNSGHVDPQDDEVIVGYNTVYAARLHEHPEYRFQKGRKGKYLEDPIKYNLSVFLKYYKDKMQEIFR